MRILIAGAGAIGSAVGGSLALAGHRVALLGRRAYVDRVRAQGLILERDGRRETVCDIAADTEAGPLIHSMGGVDLTIVTTKVFDTQAVCRAVGGAASTIVLQNGVGGDAIAAEVLGDVPIVSGVITWVVATRDASDGAPDGATPAPGVYTVRSRRRGLALAPYTGSAGLVAGLARILRRAGLRCHTYDDARAIRWSKLLLNMLGNAIPAIVDMSPAEVFADRRLYALERAAFLEAVGVMRAAGIPVVDLPGYPVRALVALMERLPEEVSRPLMARLIAGGRSGKAPSLQLDVQRGRTRSEVTALNGAVAGEAQRLGVPAPDNSAINATLLALLAGDVPRSDLARHPEALLRRVVATD
ncbi:MAG TPA: ketopantoate reductase family protein [Chloroflexi bacterium]|jgi:2-dehydropantoate 2-reductase|nr:ketopantoate reductase family protein [Chloroflexota bacterium]